ncbi:hypothetical protein H6G33_09775 [Calothrix sp. FACHB-1219]|uniref:hypothetical protein n=1 Tax=unclassified Calothrix TaxID=2619626 RepID=UPI0016879442|nr:MULTISPECIES: hypothetical protein [unclassified Calothrix]MBD2201634.1 hypothetical protein [Calothrix sp. FACHB-168]MBD2217320.1 hypothetical protein [Calothrix sp. FACHB-1219]
MRIVEVLTSVVVVGTLGSAIIGLSLVNAKYDLKPSPVTTLFNKGEVVIPYQ